MPGHTYIWGMAYPEITACMGLDWETNAAEPPSGQLDPTNTQTYSIISQLIGDLSLLFKDDYWHIGGDEVNFPCWQSDTQIVNYMTQNGLTLNDLVQMFESKVVTIVNNNNKNVMVWEEMVLDHNVTYDTDTTLVQVWRGSDNVAAVINKGFNAIVSSSNYWYLDCGHGDWLSGGTSWCDPYKTWMTIYSYDLCEGLSPSVCSSQVKGGEICLWSEQSDPENMDRMLWPRSSAAAEVLWSGQDGSRQATDAVGRMFDIRFRLVKRGIHAEPIQPLFCARNPSLCTLS